MLSNPISWFMLLILGSVTGVLAALLGIGGGLLMVPALTFLGVPLVEATATSLVGVFLSALSGSLQNLRMGLLDWQTSLTLSLFGLFTAQAGAWLGNRIPDAALSFGFAGLLVLTIYLLDLQKKLQQTNSPFEDPPANEDPPAKKIAEGKTKAECNVQSMALIGVLAGGLSGLFGVGGGMVMVPLQMLLLKEPIKSAVRTSLGAIVIIATSGLVQHSLNDNVLWIPGLCLGTGGVIGAQFGSRWLPHLSDRTINLLFRSFLIVLAVYMIIRGVWGDR